MESQAAGTSSDPGESQTDPADNDNEEEDEEETPESPELTAAEIVQAGLAQGELDRECVAIDQCDLDEVEEQLIQEFVQGGCKCDFGAN